MSNTNHDGGEYQLAEDANICTQFDKLFVEKSTEDSDADQINNASDKVSTTNQYIRFHNCTMIFIYKG
jgi:hypothetical protein